MARPLWHHVLMFGRDFEHLAPNSQPGSYFSPEHTFGSLFNIKSHCENTSMCWEGLVVSLLAEVKFMLPIKPLPTLFCCNDPVMKQLSLYLGCRVR